MDMTQRIFNRRTRRPRDLLNAIVFCRQKDVYDRTCPRTTFDLLAKPSSCVPNFIRRCAPPSFLPTDFARVCEINILALAGQKIYHSHCYLLSSSTTLLASTFVHSSMRVISS